MDKLLVAIPPRWVIIFTRRDAHHNKSGDQEELAISKVVVDGGRKGWNMFAIISATEEYVRHSL